jgi:signal peptidase I
MGLNKILRNSVVTIGILGIMNYTPQPNLVYSKNDKGEISSYKPYKISGNSMRPTLYTEDQVLVDFGKTTKNKGDIFVFMNEGDSSLSKFLGIFGIGKETLVKRIYGTPGDIIEYCSSGDSCHTKMECYISGACMTQEDCPTNCNLERITLDDDEYFMVGDNVLESVDSREFGPINKSDLIGKVSKIIKGTSEDFRKSHPPTPVALSGTTLTNWTAYHFRR